MTIDNSDTQTADLPTYEAPKIEELDLTQTEGGITTGVEGGFGDPSNS